MATVRYSWFWGLYEEIETVGKWKFWVREVYEDMMGSTLVYNYQSIIHLK